MNIEKTIGQMTLEEKASLLSGYQNMATYPIERLSIPSLTLSDGPNGLRIEKKDGNSMSGISNTLPSTCFPSGVNLASSFDKELIHQIGNAIAEECVHYDVNIVLGPAINIKRNPLGGRNFEYYSEDPFLSGKIAESYVEGVQENGKVGCCLKHYACNNNEKYRYVGDSIVDLRALHEIYLKPFEMAVRNAHPFAIMSAYNKVNGIHCSENGYLQNEILRDTWGFDGITMTDWGGIVSRESGLLGGTDIEMPGQIRHSVNLLIDKVKNKEMDISLLDQSVRRILKTIEKTRIEERKEADFKKDYDLAVEAVENSAVLLKNDDDILPLKKEEKYIVIGDFFDKIRYQGSGSALLNPYYLYSHHEIFDKNKINYEFYQGFKEEETKVNEELEKRTLCSIKNKDETILFFGGLNDYVESEGFDRDNIRMPENQISLLKKLIKMNKKVVLILHNGSVIGEDVLDSVTAILDLLLPGEGGAEGCYNLLFGNCSPSGKLAETWIKNYDDVPFGKEFTASQNEVYKESIFVGYRYYLDKPEAVRYPFGYGLSYSKFEYSSLKIEEKEEEILLFFQLKNIGERDAKEVAEVYVSHDSSLFHPKKELKGFEKVFLKAGESKEVKISINKKDLEIYDINEKKFSLEKGEYTFEISSSILDKRLEASLLLEGETLTNPYSEEVSEHYTDLTTLTDITNSEFEEVLGYKIPEIKKEKKITFETPIKDFNKGFGKLFKKTVLHIGNSSFKKASKIKDPLLRERKKKAALFIIKMIPNNSLRSLCYSSSGMLKYNVAQGLLLMCNGHLFKGVIKMCKKDK